MSARSIIGIVLGLVAIVSISAQPVLSYLIPDIGAPGMAVYVEFIAPNAADINGSAFSASDGIFLNNPSDPLRIELVRPEDSSIVVFGPCVVSWQGRVISTVVFVSPTATPNSWDWRQLSSRWRIPIRIRTPNGVTVADTFYVVQPTPAGDLRSRSETVLGRPPLGIRSRRGALLFDSLLLGGRAYTIATDDPDGNSANGNQGYLPVVLMCTGPIRGVSASQTRLSVDANGIDAGPGGGGGGGEFCDIAGGGSRGGNGFTAGGRGGNNSPNSYQSIGTASGRNGASLNETGGGTDGGAYESAGGGTGHPFGASGVGCSSGPDCSPDGARGGASGVSDNRDGAGGGYGTDGGATSTASNNGGKTHGDTTLVPLAGGSGGASGNPRNSSFPFVACGGRGGGGGGAIALVGSVIEQLTITANGADGAGSGTTSSRRGGSGSGGGIIAAGGNGISQINLSAQGGGQSAPTGKGGTGRIRYDAPGTPSIVAQPPSGYRGPTMDTVTVARGNFTIGGSGSPGKTVLLFAKPSNGVWQLLDSVIIGADAQWRYNLSTPPGAEYLYLAAAQREQSLIVPTRYAARPAAVFSHTSARIVRVLTTPLTVRPNQLDMGRISCAVNGGVARDSVLVSNPGNQPFTLTNGFFLDPSSGFRIVRPQPLRATIAAGDSLWIVIEFRTTPGRFGSTSDTLVISGGTPEQVVARVPVRIVTDSATVVVTEVSNTVPIGAIDFAEACRGSAKERTFVLRLVGTNPATITSIATGTSLFSVVQPSRLRLGVGDTVHIRIRAVPPDAGDYYDTLAIAIDLCQQTISIPIHIRGITTKIVAIGIGAGNTVDFGDLRIGNTRTIRVGIANTSTSDSVVIAPPVQPRSPFAWQTVPPGRSFPRSIAARDTLWIDVIFTPPAIGTYSDSLVFVSQQIGATCPDTVRFRLVGRGTLASIVPSKALMDFGTIACGTRRDTLWLKNSGNSDAQVFFPATIGGTDQQYFDIVEQPASAVTVRAGDSVRVVIEAHIFPQNNDGIKTATLSVTIRDDSTRVLDVQLQLQQQALVLEFTPQPYILVDVPVNYTSQSQPPLTVRNTSSVEACIADIRTTRPEIVPLQRILRVPPYSASRDLYFSITPTSLSPIEDTITIVLSCPCVDSFKIPIRVEPTNNALSLTPRPLDFGVAVPCTTIRRTLTIKNNDPLSSASLEGVAIVGADSGTYRITSRPWGTLPFSIPSGFSITIEIEFDPHGTRAGTRTAALAIHYIINGQDVRDTVILTGERTVPIDADTLLDFGEVKQGDTRTLPLRLTNNYTRSMTYTFGVAQWTGYFAVSPPVVNIDVVTKNSTADVEFNARDIGEFDDTLWVRFTSLGMNCTDSVPVLLHAVSIPGIGFRIWLDSLRILNPRDRDVALDIYAQLDTNLVLPNAQLLLVLDLPNQLFMPTGVRARGGRILSFNSRTHERHNITVTIDTLLVPISNQPQVIAQLIGDAMLGDRQCDSIAIDQARWTNSGIKPTTWLNPGLGNGRLCVTLCGAGGPRLLGSSLQLPLMTVAPNPLEDNAQLTIAPNESGDYRLDLVAADGTVLASTWLGRLSAGSAYEMTFDMSPYAAGAYWFRLRTPSAVRHYPVTRMK
ncbi:MAG: choice-of-anchor D domain-containing protein [Chlorobi bacterium]|nr:choice-of-anchor D domain-containing protein [Chlorobiota bacterium]